MDFLLLEGANIWDVYQKYYQNDLSEYEYKILALCDPTSKGENKGKYLPWIIKQYLNNNSQLRQKYIKDIARSFNKQLDWYDKHRTLLPLEQQDISRLSEDALDNIYESYKDNLFSKRELRDRIRPVYTDEEWLIYTPSTWQEERMVVWDMYGGASWCTAADSENGKHYFNQYIEDGDKLYVHVRLSDKALFQFSPQSHEFHDSDNEQVEYDDLGLSQGVIQWYQESENIDIVEELEQNSNWDDDLIFSSNSEIIGYLHNNILYDIDRDEIESDTSYTSIQYVGRQALCLLREDGGCDFYSVDNRNFLDIEFRDVHYVSWVDEYDEGCGFLIGLDHDQDFVWLSMYDGRSGYESGEYNSINEIDGLGEEFFLCDKLNGKSDILSLCSEDLLFAYDVSHNYGIETDDSGDYIIYYREDSEGNVHAFKRSRYGEHEEEEIFDNEEIDDEEEYAESMAESVISKNIISEFQRITKQLDEIHKRNIPLFFD